MSSKAKGECIIYLHNEGSTASNILKMLKIPHGSVCNILKHYDDVRRVENRVHKESNHQLTNFKKH